MATDRLPPSALQPIRLVSVRAASDALEPVMQVMQSAFDPAYGEAWNRSQTRSMLAMPLTHVVLAELPPAPGADEPGDPVGFSMSRRVGDEEELLLIAVLPNWRHFGAGSSLLSQVIANAKYAQVSRIFLEMRANNPASHLYRKFGFLQVGIRKNYYKGTDLRRYDALTLLLKL